MVQHVVPKGFKRIRYYGVQATKTFAKVKRIIQVALAKVEDVVKGAVKIIHQGKPPALLGDSQSLTVPGVCRSGAMTASPHGRLAYPIPRMECLVLTLRLR